MRILTIFFLIVLSFPADSLAQVSPADSIQKPPDQDKSRKFEALFFDGIKEKAVENYDKAISIFNKCKELKPSEGIVYVELAKCHSALKDLLNAEKNYKLALEHLPEKRHKFVLIELYDQYKQQKDPLEALGIASKLNEDPYYQLESVKINQLLGRFDEALQELNELEKEHPFYAEFHKYRYEIYSERERPDEAIAFYEGKTKNQPENVWNYCKLIEFLMMDGQAEKALKTADKLDAKKTGNAQAWLCLSKFYIEADKKDKATSYVKKILSDKFISEKAKFKTLEEYRAYVGEHPELQSELLSMLNDALEMEKSAASNLENARYYEDKDPEKGLAFYRSALEDQPNNFKLLKKVALMELEQGNLKRAVKVAQQARSLFPGQAVFYYVAGKAKLGSKEYQQAITDLKEALSYLYDDKMLEKNIKQALAKAYQALGNEDKANELLKEVSNIPEQ